MKTKLIARSNEAGASIRKEEDKNYLEFYPVVFNQQSKLIREWGEVFYEIIAPEALTNVLADPGLNCLATVDHDRDSLLGRNKSGTLQLSTDDKGLKAIVELPDTNLGRDMAVLIARGDYFECSFIYTIAPNGVKYDSSGEIPVRTVTDIADLYDVSIVLDGAFANTTIKKRALEMISDATVAEREAVEASKSKPEPEINSDILLKQLEILNLKK